MNKTLILVRHAHRDTSQGKELNNGISEKGKKQAKLLTKYFIKRFAHTRPFLYSSAKRRCIQTLDGISKKTGAAIAISPELMEEGGVDPAETHKSFEGRLKRFCEDWLKSEAELTVASSHGDCIPILLKQLIGVDLDLKKGGWAEIIWDEETARPKLFYLIQQFY